MFSTPTHLFVNTLLLSLGIGLVSAKLSIVKHGHGVSLPLRPVGPIPENEPSSSNGLETRLCSGGHIVQTSNITTLAAIFNVTTMDCLRSVNVTGGANESVAMDTVYPQMSNSTVETANNQTCTISCVDIGPSANLSDCMMLTDELSAAQGNFSVPPGYQTQISYNTCAMSFMNYLPTNAVVTYSTFAATGGLVASECVGGTLGDHGGMCNGTSNATFYVAAYGL
ncbi:uncharacterized protein FIBRA_02836 [Fibroporia radiculosa]|uniref:Uncharacterized protein n=1 Tax=Fibroporia radiculosa TaxID=599839 RepID=J4H227_9APHY|nr:uncharacterized protein FIBRA_02836 [Fibroporia radiculosa]CCM00794.1 predicted protein [Fibroporia radiculosa]